VMPSSSGMFYPGSNYAPSPSGSARQASSRSSTSSGISVVSAQEALQRVQSSQSIQGLARKISRDLGDLDGTANDLHAWFVSLDPTEYRKRAPWPPGMLNAYKRYKAFAEDHGTAHTEFETYLRASRKNTTPEQHAERARLAIGWASTALRYAC